MELKRVTVIFIELFAALIRETMAQSP